VVDLGDGRISGVRYNSIAPLQKRNQAAAELDRTVMAINLDESF